MPARRVPDRGDVVWLELSPQLGTEQAGHRPAVVLSPAAYNRVTGRLLCCPVTSRVRGYPFEVVLGAHEALQGAVLSDQVRAVDWRARRAVVRGRVADGTLNEVRARLSTLLTDP